MSRAKDNRTLDLFAVPQPEQAIPGRTDYAFDVSNLVSQILKASPLDRYEIAARMSRSAGEDISKNTLDAWASPARSDHNLSLCRAPLLEEAASSHILTDWLTAKRGGRVAYGAEALNAELGKLEVMRSEINTQIRDLRRMMDAFQGGKS